MGSAHTSPQKAADKIAAIENRATRVETRFADGVTTWRVWGDGFPIVLLHGDFGSWSHWIRNVLPLSTRFRVIAPDIPGYGNSTKPAANWNPELLAAMLAEGLSEILDGSCEYLLAGFSFGGIIAGHLAAVDAERVRKLALVGPGGFGIPYPPLPPLKRLDPTMDVDQVIAAHRHNLSMLMIADPAQVSDLAVQVQIENVRKARIRAGDIPQSDSLLRALEKVRAPIWAMWGEWDAMSGPTVRERERILRRYQPAVDFRIIPSAGHWAPFEAPDPVNRALVEMAKAG